MCRKALGICVESLVLLLMPSRWPRYSLICDFQCPLVPQRIAEVERLLFAKKPWPAFLLVGYDTVDGWDNCPDVAKDALEWMTTSAVGLLDIASVEPLTPICEAFKALIEAAGGAAEAEEKLRDLISWCSFIIGVLIKLGKTGGGTL